MEKKELTITGFLDALREAFIDYYGNVHSYSEELEKNPHIFQRLLDFTESSPQRELRENLFPLQPVFEIFINDDSQRLLSFAEQAYDYLLQIDIIHKELLRKIKIQSNRVEWFPDHTQELIDQYLGQLRSLYPSLAACGKGNEGKEAPGASETPFVCEFDESGHIASLSFKGPTGRALLAFNLAIDKGWAERGERSPLSWIVPTPRRKKFVPYFTAFAHFVREAFGEGGMNNRAIPLLWGMGRDQWDNAKSNWKSKNRDDGIYKEITDAIRALDAQTDAETGA